MSDSIFRNIKDLDTDYLDAAYADDAETAAVIFEQYLADFPGNLEVLKESIRNRDVERFQHHIHKQKPGFSYVGLTDVTQKIQELQVKCTSPEDMNTYKPEIDAMVSRIEASKDIISKTLTQLQS
jgi:HPt (histidine-containing phosphotransfer) domain-containing protein